MYQLISPCRKEEVVMWSKSVSCLAILFGLVLAWSSPAAAATDWNFEEIIVDENPPQSGRITDCSIVDVNGDGLPDLWYSAKGRNSEMPWYKNTGGMKDWKRCTPPASRSCWCS